MLLLAFSLIFVISFINWLSGTRGRRINEAESSRRPLEVLLLSGQPSELLGISRGSRQPSSEGAPGSSPNSVSERYFVGVRLSDSKLQSQATAVDLMSEIAD
jgi:hypothetical protein